MTTTLIVELIKGSSINGTAPLWPRMEDDASWMAVGSSRPLEDAWRIAQVEMITWLGELYGLDKMDGYQVVSQLAKAPIANVVDANYSSAVKLPKSILPASPAYGGMHQHLRSRTVS